MVVQKVTARVQRWQLLARYYVNKWHYDGSKWAERAWYGERKNSAASVASVPFMITRNMRAQLEQAGFPAQEISSLVPTVAHQLLTEKVTYAQYVAQKQKEIAELAAQAAEKLAQEEAQAQTTTAGASDGGLLIVPQQPVELDEEARLASTPTP
uniref:Uncharacterized protein n=1 Tax=Globisporangium ultimum (strain ATCC 200006 / CBS 805.95 / DAOM BR144) TaxID=431595 RepID=K3WCL3_GLOUD